MHSCRFCGLKGRFYRDEPIGYVQWHEWAEQMSKTHHQEQCPGCNRFTIWRKGVAIADAADPDHPWTGTRAMRDGGTPYRLIAPLSGGRHAA